jgi:hypothetical protein
MSVLPERTFTAFLARAARRERAIAGIMGAAAGAGIAALALALGRLTGALADASPIAIASVSAALIIACAAIGVFGLARPREIAQTIERRTPSSRNLIRTAAELRDGRATAPAHVTSRVFADAATLAATIDLRRLFPSRPAALAVAVAIALWTATAAATWTRTGFVSTGGPAAQPSSASAASVGQVEISIVEPPYAGGATTTARDPVRVEALAGSRLRLRVTADAAGVTLDTITTTGQPLQVSGARTFTIDLDADADGFLALAPLAADGSTGARRLIGLTVRLDRAPQVRVTAPGRDLLLPNGNQTIALAVEADDDRELASLELRYTRIGGSGENFTFTDGALALDVTRASERAWTARATWPLGALALEPGDMVIYRGVATDRRPGATPAESDTFILEVVTSGSLPSEGFAIDDRENRYAISQQMVILRTERLAVARRTMPDDEFRREAQGLAAEQRQVRAEFVFMMGGELADAGLDAASLGEEHEAEHEDELAAGRLVNQGRAELMRAIRAMSRAATRLTEADLTAALPIEKEALTYLQRAFSRNRYILRTLSERERLDLTRRLTGVLASLARDVRPVAAPAVDARVTALRAALSDLAATSGNPSPGAIAQVAQRVLAVDPASPELRDVAAALVRASDLLASDSSRARAAADLERAALGLAAAARRGLPPAPTRHADPALDALAGALADALRRGGAR